MYLIRGDVFMRVKYYIVKFVNEFERYLSYNTKAIPVGIKKIKLQEQPTIFLTEAEAEDAIVAAKLQLKEEMQVVVVV